MFQEKNVSTNDALETIFFFNEKKITMIKKQKIIKKQSTNKTYLFFVHLVYLEM